MKLSSIFKVLSWNLYCRTRQSIDVMWYNVKILFISQARPKRWLVLCSINEDVAMIAKFPFQENSSYARWKLESSQENPKSWDPVFLPISVQSSRYPCIVLGLYQVFIIKYSEMNVALIHDYEYAWLRISRKWNDLIFFPP